MSERSTGIRFPEAMGSHNTQHAGQHWQGWDELHRQAWLQTLPLLIPHPACWGRGCASQPLEVCTQFKEKRLAQSTQFFRGREIFWEMFAGSSNYFVASQITAALEALQAVIIAPFSSIRQSWTKTWKLLWNHSRQRGNVWTSFILGYSKPKLSSKPKKKSSPAKSLITEMKKETTKLNEKMIETIFLFWKSLFWSYCQKKMREQQKPLIHHWCF